MSAKPIPLPLQYRQLSIVKEADNPQQQIKFVNPNSDNFERNILNAARLVEEKGLQMPEKDLLKGSHAVIVGSGPSLSDPKVIEAVRQRQKDGYIIFATKAAIQYLEDQGIHPEFGVSMDPGAHIACPAKISKVTGVIHIIASSSDPRLFEYLMSDEEGEPAEVWVFHSACGLNRVIDPTEYEALPTDKQALFHPFNIVDEEGNPIILQDGTEKTRYGMSEVDLCEALFPEGTIMGGGFNVVNRALSLALFMGCEKITLAGTDCGWRREASFYVNGNNNRPGVDMSDNGIVDGVPWNTRPDMLASGVALARVAQSMGDNMEILGDTLPASLRSKDETFLRQCAEFGK